MSVEEKKKKKKDFKTRRKLRRPGCKHWPVDKPLDNPSCLKF